MDVMTGPLVGLLVVGVPVGLSVIVVPPLDITMSILVVVTSITAELVSCRPEIAPFVREKVPTIDWNFINGFLVTPA